jgi:tetratricopeptide (TPR) repeat protein
VLGILGLAGAAVGLSKKRPLASLGILFFFVTIAPESLLIPQYLFCGYRAVLPMAGVLMVAADGLAALLTRQEKRVTQLAFLMPLLLIVCLSTTTFSQAKKWNPLSVWTDAYAHLPEYSPDVEKYPYLDVLSSYASELGRSGQYPAAIALFKEAIEVDIDPRSDKKALAMGSLGLMLMQNGDTEEGIAYLKQVVELHPRGAWGRYNLGIALLKTGHEKEGLNCIQEAVKLYPDDLDARLALGNIFRESGRFSEAVEQYRAALKVAPRSARIHHLLGIALEKAGHSGPAIESYRNAVKLLPESPEFRFNLGNALSAAGNSQEAIENYETAVKLKPDFGPAQANLGTLLLKSGRVPEAVTCFQKAVAIMKDNAELYNQLGQSLAEMDRNSEAVQAFGKALTIMPDHEAAKRNLEKLTKTNTN